METIRDSKINDHKYLLTSNVFPEKNDLNNKIFNEINKELDQERQDKFEVDNKNAQLNTSMRRKNTSKPQLVKTQDEEKDVEEALYRKMCSDLPLYQDKIKRDKDLYKEEFFKFLKVFIKNFNNFLETPSNSHAEIKDIFVFLAHLSHIFTRELAFLPAQLSQLLEHSHAIIHPETRLSIIEAFNLLRKKNLIEPIDILPLFFQLLTCQDKELRQQLQEIIVNDLHRINEKSKNMKVNKFIRNKCSEMLLNPNFKAARKTLNIMILLYKKKIWNDDKTVNAIAQACYSKDSKIAYAACKFFLSEYEEIDEEGSENDEMGDLKQKFKLLGKGNNKKTKKRKDKIKGLMKAVERRENRKEKIKVNKDFMPIDLINDPTSLCEKMFERIKHVKNKKHYKLKVILIRIIGRIAGRHKILINNFFSFTSTLIRPKQDDLPTILASIVEATHHMVSAKEIEPVIHELYDYFICESFPAQYITVGVNTVREIVERCHNAITYDQFTAVEDLKKVKNKSVSLATRSLINMIRDVNPDLMDNKVKDEHTYTQVAVNDGVVGMDLLKYHEGMDSDYKFECNELLTDKQLKKLRLLKLKDNAELVQRIRINLSKNDVNDMLGEKRDRVDINGNVNNQQLPNIIQIKKISNNKNDNKNKKNNDKKNKQELNLKEQEEEEEEEEDEDDDECSELSDESFDDDVEIDDDECEEYEDDEDLEEGEDEEDEAGSLVEDSEIEGLDKDAIKDLNNKKGNKTKNNKKSFKEDEDESDSESVGDESLNSEEQARDDLNNLLDLDKDNDENKRINIDDTEDEDEDDNEFVEEHQIDTYKNTRKERRLAQKEDEKDEFKMKRKKKAKGQKTNVEARKNKPNQMVIHKINKKKHIKDCDKNLQFRIKNLKRQMGRLKRGNMVLKKEGGSMGKKNKKKMNSRTAKTIKKK
jgi:protein SDA1